MIIVMDLNYIRYTHPEDALLGVECDYPDLKEIYVGETYTGYTGSALGDSLRGFVPVYTKDLELIGIATAGVLVSEVQEAQQTQRQTIILAFSVGLILSLGGLWGLSNRFRSNLLGFSPSEIALLYAENKSIIEQLDEAVISIDNNCNVTTLNKTAMKMFDIEGFSINQKVQDVFPYVDFQEILHNKISIINKYRKINDKKYLMNAYPLYLENKLIGATAIFRSHYEVDALLDQIQGYQQIAAALRNQKHEFQNKLHVVLGLIKMKDYLKAESYIMENVYTTNLASDYYSSRIKDDRILALFVGKEIQSKEYNASIMLTSDSYITKSHRPITSDDIVLILGNLIDNAFEAYVDKDMEEKRVVIDVFEDEEQVKITVIDQAGGISEDVIDKMFERGVSTKNGDSRGTGLSLVNEIITIYDGERHVDSTNEETKIEIILRKVKS
jgi:sensor histidine kinase regulating citrate/malate metabolism